MYIRAVRRAFAPGILVLLLNGGTASAQDPVHQHGDAAQAPAQEHQHDMSAMDGIPMTRDGSGTSWLPDETPMYALHREANGWMLMLHANGFL